MSTNLIIEKQIKNLEKKCGEFLKPITFKLLCAANEEAIETQDFGRMLIRTFQMNALIEADKQERGK